MAYIDCHVTFCTFFEGKEQFIYGEETYSELTLFCVESGSFDYSIGEGATYTARRGQVVACPAGKPFRRAMRETAAFGMIRLAVEQSIAFGDAPLEPREPARFLWDLRELHNCRFRYHFEEGDSDGHFCRDIWYLIQPLEERPSDGIAKAFETVCRRYAEPLSVDRLAVDAGYSTVHFINRFKRRYGVTPGEQITRLRLGRARELLESSVLSVGEIAHAVGYTDEFYFSRLFRRRFGASPREYRKEGREAKR